MIRADAKDFKEIIGRDAWSSIRGYVYQVDHTILGWMRLNPDEIIELEKGEDYDIVKLSLDGSEVKRYLGQIKHRENNLTLNSDTAFESIVNFYKHKLANPELVLKFRFITNIGYGKERPALFSDGLSGIEAWIQLCRAKDINLDDEKLIVIQNQLLKKADGLIAATEDKDLIKVYQAFREMISDAVKLIQFVKDFEWGVSNVSGAKITETVEAEIAKRGFETAQAKEIYPRLFLYVFKTLSKDGRKFLDTAQLIAQLKLPELSAVDQALFTNLSLLLSSFEERIANIEVQVQNNTDALSDVIAKNEVSQKLGAVYTSGFVAASPIVELVQNASLRAEKVRTIIEKFTNHTWISLQGINASGKTQIASLIARQYEKSYWLDLRPFSDNEAHAEILMRSFLHEITNTNKADNSSHWLINVANVIPDGALIVINDIPRTNRNSRLANLMASLANEFAISKKRLLTTSNFDMIPLTKELIKPDVIIPYNDFDFSDAEIIEFLQNSSVPEIYNQFVYIIAIRTHRNPRLISAVIRHISAMPASEDTAAINAILDQEISENILSDIQGSIKSFIPNIYARELLYRLSLIQWDYAFGVIQKICGVEERISHPKEVLTEILNTWIQSQGETYLTSPIIYDLGKGNLEDSVVKATYKAAGEALIEQKKLDEVSAGRAINSFISASEWNEAARILITVLNSANTTEKAEAVEAWGYLDYWRSVPIPKEVNINLRTLIRTEQRRINSILKKDVQLYNQDLCTYFEESESSRDKTLIAMSILSSFNLTGKEFFLYFNYAINNIQELDYHGEPVVDRSIFGHLIWVPASTMSTMEDIDIWIHAIDAVKEQINPDILSAEIAPNAVLVIKNNLIRDWTRISDDQEYREETLAKLNKLANYFESIDNEQLFSIIFTEIIKIEYFNTDEKTVILTRADDRLKTFKSKYAVYRLSSEIGKVLFPSNDAVPWLDKAISTDCYGEHTFPETLVYSASKIAPLNMGLARSYVVSASNIIQRNSEFDTDRLQYLGEKAIAYWCSDLTDELLDTLSDFVSALFKIKAKGEMDQIWYRLYALAGHLLAYISTHIVEDEIPKFPDGKEFIKPEIGFFTVNTKDLAFKERYNEANEALMFVYMARIAERLGNPKVSGYWANKAFDTARSFGDAKVISMVSVTTSQYTLISRQFEAAFEQYLLDGTILSAFKSDGQSAYRGITNDLIKDLYNERPSDNWAAGEDTALIFAIVPMTIIVLTAILNNEQDYVVLRSRLISLVEAYLESAAGKDQWKKVVEILALMFSEESTYEELNRLSGSYSERIEDTHLQILSMLGLINQGTDKSAAVWQLINIIPYIEKVLDRTKAVNPAILVPFVKTVCISALTNLQIENTIKQTLKSRIDLIDNREQYALQHVLQIAVAQIPLAISEDRKRWLYEYVKPI